VSTKDRHWTTIIDRLQATLDRSPNRIPMYAECGSGFFDRVATMCFNKTMIGVRLRFF
jgi:hypothetical protein